MLQSTRFLQMTLLAMGLFGLAQALPAMYGGVALGLSADLRDKLYGGEEMTDEELDRYAALRRQALNFWDSWQAYDDLAQATLTEAVQDGLDKPEARKHLPEVMDNEKEALLRNPANAFAWARLAYARMMYNGPSRLVTEPLWQSIQTGPYEPSLLPSRIMLMLQTRPYWTPDMQDVFPRQLDLAFLRNGQDTARAAYLDNMGATLRTYLSGDPSRLADYDSWSAEWRVQDGGKASEPVPPLAKSKANVKNQKH